MTSIVGTGEQLDQEVFDRFAARLSYVSGDFADAATYERVGAAIKGARAPGVLPRDPAVPLRHRRQGPRRGRTDRRRAGRRREAVRSRPRRRRGPSPPSCTSTSTSRSSSGSTTTSARWDSRRSSTSASRTRCSSRSGTGTTSSACRSRWRRDFGVEDRGHFYDPVGALRDVVVNHLMQVVAAAAMEPPAGGDPETLKDAQVAVFRAIAHRRPGALRARPVRRLPRHRRRRAGLDDRDLRGAAPRHRQLALVRGAVLHPHRQAPAGHPDRGPARVQAARRGSASRCSTARPEPDQLVVKLDPSTGRPDRCWTRIAPTRTRRSRSRSTWSSPRRAARARPRTRCCCTPRWSGRAPASRGRTASRRRGGSCSRCSTRLRRCTRMRPGSWGPEAADKLVAGHGAWRDPWIES